MTTRIEEHDLTIDIDDDEHFTDPNNQGWRYLLIFEPEDRKVSTWSCIGSGTPEIVWNRCAISMACPATTGEHLRGWLVDRAADIDALFAEYEGYYWDGSNHRGKWTADAAELEGELVHALGDDDFPEIWQCGDWMQYGHDDVDDAILAGKTDDEIEEEIILSDADSGEIIEGITEYIAERREEAIPDIDTWTVPPACQGQIVEVSYGVAIASGTAVGWSRAVDHSDGTTSYAQLGDVTDAWDPANTEPVEGEHYGDVS